MGATNPNAGGAPGGGGKGGMGMNRGPGGNAQNNPGGRGPISNDNGYGNFGPNQNMSPMQAFANMGNTFQGLGSAGGNPINSTANSVGQSMGGSPMANWLSMARGAPGASAFNLPPSFGGGGNPNNGMGRPDGFGGGGNLTPINQAAQPPQQYQPSTGWVDGQPAQWAAQKAAMNNPAPSPQQGILDIRNRMLYGR